MNYKQITLLLGPLLGFSACDISTVQGDYSQSYLYTLVGENKSAKPITLTYQTEAKTPVQCPKGVTHILGKQCTSDKPKRK